MYKSSELINNLKEKTMENNSISLELEEMRLQMATLQQQLNEHLKLNEELLQNNIIKKTNNVSSKNLLYNIMI